jgi:hypothetical protein
MSSYEYLGEIGTLYLAFLFGIIAYSIRRWVMPLYATIEIFFGTYGAGIALMMLHAPEYLPPAFQPLAATLTWYPQYLGLGAATYVIVRGLDNLVSWLERWAKKKQQAKHT